MSTVTTHYTNVGTCMTQSRMFHTHFCKENQRIGLVHTTMSMFFHIEYILKTTHTKKKRNAEKLVHVHMGQDKWILELSHYNNTHHHRRFVYDSNIALHWILFIIVWEFFGNEGSMWKNSMSVCVVYVNVQILQLKIESSLLINHLEYFFFVCCLCEF